MSIFKEKEIVITISRNTASLAVLIIIILFFLGGLFWARAAFIEPDFAPGDSDQDFAQNILGANNTDNEFDSGSVAGNNDGSIIERVEYIKDFFFGFSEQKNQIYDDWKGSASSSAISLANAYANAVDQSKEEGEWASTTDTNLGSETIASGVVKRDQRTGLYWSDCYSSAQDGICDPITNSYSVDGSIADDDDGLDAEGGNSVDFCESLILDADGDGSDETDWYLPSEKELIQAYIDGAANNLPNPDYSFWSTTERWTNEDYAYYVRLYYGKVDASYAKTSDFAARCVCR